MERRLWRTMGQLERLAPEFYSMTYGALGSAQQISVDTALAMQRESPVPLAAHLTCANAGEDEVMQVAESFYAGGIRRIVALRGDAVVSADNKPDYAFPSAVGLVSALGRYEDLDISVAAYPEVHPQAHSATADLQHLKRKFDAGASRAITQYFFDADCFFRFRDAAIKAGIDSPIVPGILPIHDLDKVKAFSQRCGASVPAGFDALFDRAGGDSQAAYRIALDLAVELCQQLVSEGVDHIHLYTLNQTDMCLDISFALGAAVLERKPNSSAA